jgi:hypothetical protein
VTAPLILYIPGLLPKPEPAVHKDALRRCLIEGLRRADPVVATELANSEHGFDVVAWTYDFYLEHRDYSLDATSVDSLIKQQDVTGRRSVSVPDPAPGERTCRTTPSRSPAVRQES